MTVHGKGVCNGYSPQDSSERLAHGFGRAFLGLLGWAQAALVFACIALAFGTSAPKAYALSAKSSPEMVIDGNFVGDDEGSKGYMCAYCSPYTATLELIGHYSDIVQIDQEAYNKLMAGDNPFTAATGRWQELTGASNEEPTNTWLGDDGFIDGWLILAGKGNCWYGTFTDRQIQMAEIAFNSIMQGGSGGSGGGSGGGSLEGEYLEFSLKCYQDITWKGYSLSEGETYKVRFPNNSTITTFFSQPDYTYTVGFNPYGTDLNSIGILSIWCYVSDVPFEKFVNPSDSYVGWQTSEKVSPPYYHGALGYSSNSWYYDAGSKTFIIESYSNPNTNPSYGNNSASYYSGLSKTSYYFPTSRWTSLPPHAFIPIVGFDVTGEEPEIPDVPMPDPPKDKPTVDAPTPPKLPDPKDPIVPRQPTKPDTPTIDPHIDLPDITVVTQPTNTTPEDYTPWLRAIFEELKAVHGDLGDWLQEIVDEMANHCQHLRDEMSVQATYLGECLEAVQDEVQNAAISLSNSLGDYSEWLADYLDQWGEWLVEHLDFNNNVTVDPYDDTSLLYWIKRIYTKLGGSDNPVNSRPTDPVTNPVETGNWLEELWNEILKNLAQLFPNLMIDLGLIFDDLKSKFPFSIPWDVHALLLLLVTEPVAPTFSVPMYTLNSQFEVVQDGECEIDLDAYTPYMAGVHLMLEIVWIIYMLKHTKDYMDLIEAVIPS